MWKLIIGFLTEIGFAFVIAWAVAHLVEKGARREYDQYTQEKSKLISQNVFGYLYSVKFPRSAFRVLEEHVFSQPIIKTVTKLEYELLDGEVAPGWIKMRCEFDYTLKNLSDTAIEHPVRFHTSKVSGLNEPKVDGIGLQSLIVGDDVIAEERFGEIDNAAPDDVGLHKYLVTRSIAPNSELRVRVTFTQLKRSNDNDLWQSNSVCEGIELKLRYNPDAYNVFVEAVHPSSTFDSDIGPSGGNRCRTVRIDKALLPKNGVFMWWNAKGGNGPSGNAT